jgi:hypothetical protein
MKVVSTVFRRKSLVAGTFRLKRLGMHRFPVLGVAENELNGSGRLRDQAVSKGVLEFAIDRSAIHAQHREAMRTQALPRSKSETASLVDQIHRRHRAAQAARRLAAGMGS